MITHLEPDILECEVKRALENITTNKASGGDGIPVELFQILKDDAVKVLHSICQQIWKTQQWPQDWKRSVFIPIPKKGNAKECSNYLTIALISHASKVMLKILQAMLQQYVNCEFPDVQAGFRKGRGIRDQIAHICWIIEKEESSRKTSISALLSMPESLTVWITTNLENSSRNGNTRPPDLSLEKPVCRSGSNRTGHGTTDWFQTRIGVCQGCILSPCLFNLYTEYIMRNAGLDQVQTGIKIAGRNINNLRYADNTILMAESEEDQEDLDESERGE